MSIQTEISPFKLSS